MATGPGASMGGARAVALQQHYVNFWKLVETTARAAAETNLYDRIKAKAQGDRILVGTPGGKSLRLAGVPIHPKNKSDVVDIRLQFEQVVKPDDVLEKSTVQVSYLRRHAEDHFTVLETWHYDFAPDVPRHPVFHAQLSAIHALDDSDRITYDGKDRRPAPKGLPRIPTPPMDVPAVLAMLIMDHVPDQVEELDGDDWRKSLEGLPRLPTSYFEGKGPAQGMRLRWWYPP